MKKLRKIPENHQITTLFELYGNCGGCGPCDCVQAGIQACVGDYKFAVQLATQTGYEASYRNNYGTTTS